MNRSARAWATAAVVAVSGAALGACATDTSSTQVANPSGIATPPAVASALPTASPVVSASVAATPEPPIAAACDAASISAAIDVVLATGGEQMFTLNDFECDAGWAVAFPDIGVSEDTAVTYTVVLQDVDGTWTARERDEAVCGKPSEDMAATTKPDGALIPQSLWQMGCMTN